MRIGLFHEPPFIVIKAVLIRRQRVKVVLPIPRSPPDATQLADIMRIGLLHEPPFIAIKAVLIRR
jgi:hypothetical protein